MKAFLKNYRQSPRKVRLLADLIRAKDVHTARVLLSAAPKRAALPLRKLLDSAISNAKREGDGGDLFVKEVRVDAGPTFKRTMPRARGSAYLIHKRTSRVMLVLDTKQLKSKSKNQKAKS